MSVAIVCMVNQTALDIQSNSSRFLFNISDDRNERKCSSRENTGNENKVIIIYGSDLFDASIIFNSVFYIVACTCIFH